MALKVEIISDIVCPWCYIGKRRLDSALQNFRHADRPHIEWKAFQLAPDLPKEGLSRARYMEQKFGKEALQEMNEHLTSLGKEDGIEFRFDRIEKSPNTLLGHRLIWLGKREGHQDEVVEALFSAYFCEGLDIGNEKVIREIALRCGISASKVDSFFANDEGLAEAKQEVLEARERGITMVPFFLFNGQHWISGADTAETFERVIRELGATASGNRPAAS